MADGVMAAPNRLRITARCLTEPTVASPRKQDMRIVVLTAERLRGGQFVDAGDEVDAFAIDGPTLTPGVEFAAEAEYLGGPRQGRLQLYDVVITR